MSEESNGIENAGATPDTVGWTWRLTSVPVSCLMSAAMATEPGPEVPSPLVRQAARDRGVARAHRRDRDFTPSTGPPVMTGTPVGFCQRRAAVYDRREQRVRMALVDGVRVEQYGERDRGRADPIDPLLPDDVARVGRVGRVDEGDNGHRRASGRRCLAEGRVCRSHWRSRRDRGDRHAQKDDGGQADQDGRARLCGTRVEPPVATGCQGGA